MTTRPTWALHHGDAFAYLAACEAGSFDVCITDPPYSERQHAGVRSSKRTRLADGNGYHGTRAATRRTVDLGFDHFTRDDCLRLCLSLARVVRRWSLVFCDDGLLPTWLECARLAGLPWVRTCIWVRIGGAPQFTGDRPAAGHEYILAFHPKGRKHWNGGGKAGVYTHPIVANRSGHRNDRLHTTQKPLPLMLDLGRDFTDPGETVLDPFAGSGTTGAASLQLRRSFAGCERDDKYHATASARLSSEAVGVPYQPGQSLLWGSP